MEVQFRGVVFQSRVWNYLWWNGIVPELMRCCLLLCVAGAGFRVHSGACGGGRAYMCGMDVFPSKVWEVIHGWGGRGSKEPYQSLKEGIEP